MAYFMSYFFRISPSVVMPIFSTRLGMSASLTGFVASFYFYAYAAMQPVCGLLLDRLGPLRVVALGLLITASGTALILFTQTPFSIALWRLLTGLGLAPMFLGALVYQSAAFPLERYAFYSGLTLAVGNFGAVVGVAPLGWAIDSWGISFVFAFLSFLCVVLALSLFLKRKEDPIFCKKGKAQKSLLQNLKETGVFVFTSPVVRSIALIWSMLMGALLSLQALWAVSWFAHVYDRPFAECRIWATSIGIGVMVGTLAAGSLGTSKSSREKLLFSSTALFVIALFLLNIFLFLRLPVFIAGGASFVLGVSFGSGAVCYAARINEEAPQHLRGAVMGIVNSLIYVSVIFFQWGTGTLIDKEGYAVTYFIVFLLVAMSLFSLKKLWQH
ncbi:MAG: MFS transporter [Aminobacterium sp.]|nr:MFS transporter [Aminobacterium sp.]MDD3706788.1 MFS transporter [Aminobacterium sp.]